MSDDNDRGSGSLAVASEFPERGPALGTDPLADVLHSVKLTGALFFVIDASSPWCVDVPDASAFALLHERPAQSWTLEQLAQEVGRSRSVLADRFTRLVGRPPMQYLTRWRVQLAARLLSDGPSKVAAVALEVGYAFEAAFSRSFKKIADLSPALWRKRLGGSG